MNRRTLIKPFCKENFNHHIIGMNFNESFVVVMVLVVAVLVLWN